MVEREGSLVRECAATLIPAGDKIYLPAGTAFGVTQALGGSVTIGTEMGLFRIAREDYDALGIEVGEESGQIGLKGDVEDSPFSDRQVWNALKSCYDPEIPVNIVDLGLIYDLQVVKLEEERYTVDVKMTLTAQGCGMGPAIAADAKAKIEMLHRVESANVAIVWDPQWTPQMISEEGRKVLGLD